MNTDSFTVLTWYKQISIDSECTRFIRSEIYLKMHIFTVIISYLNVLSSLVVLVSCTAIFFLDSLTDDFRFIVFVVMLINIFNLFIIYRLYTKREIRHVKFSLKCFIVLCLFNVISIIISTEREQWTNKNLIEYIRICIYVFHVMISTQIYGVYLHYDNELKPLLPNVSHASPLSGNPSAPTVQPTGEQIAICQPVINASQEPYMKQQPGQYLTQQPVTLAYNPTLCSN